RCGCSSRHNTALHFAVPFRASFDARSAHDNNALADDFKGVAMSLGGKICGAGYSCRLAGAAAAGARPAIAHLRLPIAGRTHYAARVGRAPLLRRRAVPFDLGATVMNAPTWLPDWLTPALELAPMQQFGLAFLLGSFTVATWSDLKRLSAQREFVEIWLLFV